MAKKEIKRKKYTCTSHKSWTHVGNNNHGGIKDWVVQHA